MSKLDGIVSEYLEGYGVVKTTEFSDALIEAIKEEIIEDDEKLVEAVRYFIDMAYKKLKEVN